MQISQVHLLHASRQVHFHGNTRISQGENMQKIGSAFMQCFRNHCYMYYDSLCRETLAACYRCSYGELQSIFANFNSCSSEISARLIRNIYPGYPGVLIVQSPHLLIYTFTSSIMSVGITFVYFFVNISQNRP